MHILTALSLESVKKKTQVLRPLDSRPLSQESQHSTTEPSRHHFLLLCTNKLIPMQSYRDCITRWLHTGTFTPLGSISYCSSRPFYLEVCHQVEHCSRSSGEHRHTESSIHVLQVMTDRLAPERKDIFFNYRGTSCEDYKRTGLRSPSKPSSISFYSPKARPLSFTFQSREALIIINQRNTHASYLRCHVTWRACFRLDCMLCINYYYIGSVEHFDANDTCTVEPLLKGSPNKGTPLF